MAKTTEVVVTLRLDDKGAVDRLGALEIETKQYQRELRALNAEIAKNGTATKEQTQQVGRLSASIRSNQTVIRELKNDLSGATAAGLRFRDKMADAAKAGLGAFGLNILSVTGAITAVVSVLRNAVNTLADFDKALSSVSALGEDYAANIDKIAEATKTAGIAFGFTAVESVKAVEALAKAGVAVEDILGGGLEGALTLAAAGSLDVADAAEAAAKSMVQFGLAGEDVTLIADLFANSANKALGEVSDITAALNQSGQVANQFGISIEETVGTLTAFANAGLLGSDAGTSFRTMLLRLAKPTEDSAAAMDRLGINAFDAQGQFIGIEKLAGQLQTQLKGLTEEQRNNTLATIFGTDAIRSASILYEGGADAINKWTKEVSESGEAARIAAEKTDNLPGAVDRFNSSLANLLLKGSAVGDFFQSVVDGATDVINALSGNGFQQKEIEAFTEFVQKEYEKIGGVGELAAESGSAVVENFRFIAEGAQSATESLDFLLARGNLVREDLKGIIEERRRLEAERDRGSNPLRNKAAIEALRIEEAAGRATLTIISEEIKKRGEVAAVVKTSSEALVASTETDTDATAKKTAAVKELTAAQKEQLALEQAIAGITGGKIEGIAKPEQDLGVPVVDDKAEETEKNDRLLQEQLARFDAERQAFDDLQDAKLQAASTFAFAIGELAEEGSAAAKFLFALEKAAAIAQVIVNGVREISTITAMFPLGTPLTPLAIAAITSAKIRTAASVATIAATAIQGFATGGVVQGGQPIQRDNGDNVLITAKRGEVILNETQQERLVRLYGDDLFRRAGVPGFAGGGRVRSTRGSALVNFPTVPTPSSRELLAVEGNAIARNTNFSPVVSVVEINRLQERVRVIEQLATG